jgi:two-component system, cell cycle sensor histidine kinase and response regulator CckA
MNEQKTILIAEPDLVVASDIKKYLESLNFKVHPIVFKGEDLIDMAKMLDPSLIITDINLLGQLDGIEAIARLEGKNKIPYIFIIASDDYSRLVDSYYLNPVSMIKKPIKFNELVKSISKADQYLEKINIADHNLELV